MASPVERALPSSPPRPWLGQLGLRILLAFMAVAVAPLVVSSVATWVQSRAIVARYLAEDTGKTARLWAADLDVFLDRQRVLLRSVPLGEDSADTAGMLLTAVQANPNLDALLLMGQDGAALAASAPLDQMTPWVLDACGSLVGDLDRAMTHAGAGHAHEVVVAATREGLGDTFLCGQLDFTLHQEMLAERARSVADGTAYIVDRSARVVCHAFEEDEPHVERGGLLEGPAAVVAAEGQPWSGVIQTTDGASYAAFAPARSLPWGVWVEVPDDVAAAALEPLLERTTLLGALFILGVALAAVAASRRLVLPLQQVAAAAGEIARTRPGQTVEVRGHDEVAELAREFNRMSRALARSYNELDRRVDERTRQLATARDFSDLLLDTMQERIVVIDRAGVVLRTNRAARRAWGEDLVGLCWERLAERLGLDDSVGALDAQLGGRSEVVDEWSCHRGERTEILELTAHRLAETEDQPTAAVLILREVTELKEMQARLVHQEKMAALGTLAAGLAHEIGNPLASLSSELELLELAWDPEEARASLAVLRDQVDRMGRLLRELVDLGRQPTDQVGPVSAVELLEQAARLLRHDARARQVEMVLLPPETAAVVHASRDRVLQVLINLGLNALDALNGQGRLELSLSRPAAGEVGLVVADDGPGMDLQVVARIFDPFFTTKPPGVGTGLGLFVSQRVVDRLGGRIELDTAPGAGTRFTVVLPTPPGGADE